MTMVRGPLVSALAVLPGLLLPLGLPGQAPGAAARPPLPRRSLEAFADSFFADYLRDSRRPSLALVVVEGGRIVLEKGYGYADQDGDSPVDPDSTLFNMASLSKLITTTAVLRLVAAGRLALGADVGGILDVPVPERPGAPVTVEHLLTHTSGLEGPLLGAVVDDPSDLLPLGDYFRAHPPRAGAPPGAEVRYSSYGMTLAGRIVERASGERFEDYVDRRVFAPLGMTTATFRQPVPPWLASRIATAGSGPTPNYLQLFPAGSLVAAPHDMGLFMLSQLCDGGPVLDRAMLDTMQATHWTAIPSAPGVALGWFETRLAGVPALFHTGARTHFSLMVLVPDAGVGIFLVHSMHQGGPYQTLREDFARAFIERFVAPARAGPGADIAAGGGPAPAAPAADHRFAGVYRPSLLPSTTLARAGWMALDTRVRAAPDGRLRVALPFAGRGIDLAPAGPGLYRSDDGVVLAFRRPGGDGPDMVLSGATQDPVSFTRLAWYQRGTLHAAAALLALLLPLAWLVRSLAALRRRRAHAARPGAARAAARAATAYSSLTVAAPLALLAAVLMGGGPGSPGAVEFGLRLSLTLLLAASLTAPVLAWLVWRCLRAGSGSRSRRIHLTALSAVGLLMIPFLAYYHLLGYYF